jgi:nucleoside-diphosphate-sugar epimerase
MEAEPILITGAAGFIGFHVAQNLAASGRAVISNSVIAAINRRVPSVRPRLETAW